MSKRNQQKKKAARKVVEPPSSCEICKNTNLEMDRTGLQVDFSVERDYDASGRFRGYLCGPCKANVTRYESGLVCFSAAGIELYLKRRKDG